VPLEHLAIELARDAYPDLDPQPLLDRLDDLADRARERFRPDSPLRTRLGQVNWVLYVEEGFRGNTDDYNDARNSYLNDVLARRLGIPISLGVVYMAVASRLGMSLRGVNLPAHFMVRAEDEAGPVFIDTFLEGELLDAEGCRRRIAEVTGGRAELSPEQMVGCGTGEVIARMLRNLRSIHLSVGDLAAVLPVQRRLAALRPEDPVEQRDWALLAAQLDHPGEAAEALRRALEVVEEGPEAEALRHWLKRAARDSAERN
jgi:regulator of sirC expression with transglutaminase-like and TPR domain